MSLATVRPPTSGIWRIGRGPDPLQLRDPLGPEDLDRPRIGNRFDSPLGLYRVIYFVRTLEVCFGETLARFRPDLNLLALVGEEWKERAFMQPGAVPREWRERRVAVKVRFPPALRFVDVEAASTIEVLRNELANQLIAYGYEDLDLSVLRGPDRHITRLISNWVYQQKEEDESGLFSGIRYLSRLDSRWECWAVFEGVPIEELVRRPIFREDESLAKVAEIYGLTVF